MNCAAKKVECLQVAQKKNTLIRGPEYIYTASEDFKINKKKAFTNCSTEKDGIRGKRSHV